MNNETSQNNNIKEEIFKKIEAGEVSMTPKAYFVLKVALFIFVMFITFITSVLLVSYILFFVRAEGHLFLLGFGTRGFYEFVLVFPWILLLIDALLLLFFDWLLKRFRFGYHSPIIYLFLGTLAVITIFGCIIYRTPFHRNLMYKAEGNHLPFGAGMYDGLRKSHRKVGIFRGEVVTVSGNTFTIKYDDYDTPGDDAPLNIISPADVDVSTLLKPGDQVFVAGDLINGQIRAYGIRKLVDGE